MKKIAMYSTGQLFGNRVTGGLKRFLELYKGIANSDISVDLYSTDNPEDLQKNNIVSYSLDQQEENTKLLIPTELSILLKNKKTIDKIRKFEYDRIIVFDVPTAIGLCILGVKNIHLFIRQDLIGYKRISLKERTKNKIIENIYLYIMNICETICFLKADKIYLQCNYDYNEIIRRHKIISNIIKKKSLIQINNVNPSWVTNESSFSVVNEFVSDDFDGIKKTRIGFIGDFSNERKGQRLFVDAIKDLIETGYLIEAIIIGDGKQLEDYQLECKDYSEIKYLGRLKNPISYIKKMDLMVVPSLADSCPNTVMEAMYNEIPVIGSNSGGIPEILKNSQALFETNSLSLRKRIEYYLDNDNLIKLKEQQNKRKQELSFDWSSVVLELLKKN